MMEGTLFEATAPVAFCDYFRIPYVVRGAEDSENVVPGWHRIAHVAGRGPALRWPDFEHPGRAVVEPSFFRLGELLVYARLVPASELDGIASPGDGWQEFMPITDASGVKVGAARRRVDGSFAFPFDPGEAMESFWSEAYLDSAVATLAGRTKRIAMRGYYRIRPILPRSIQIALRRAFSRIQRRTSFPRWPLETALHDLYGLVLAVLAEVAGEPVPSIAPWPDGRRWAVVLTHDVEQQIGHDNVHVLRQVEEEAGFRSSWNFVPRRYDISDALLDDLRAAGFEIGVHGLYHDGRDLESEELLLERLPAIRSYAEEWRAVGFRSPATHRDWRLMPLLGFDYDSSSPDTDPFEPQSGGCCSLLPFHNGELVELPITLPKTTPSSSFSAIAPKPSGRPRLLRSGSWAGWRC